MVVGYGPVGPKWVHEAAWMHQLGGPMAPAGTGWLQQVAVAVAVAGWVRESDLELALVMEPGPVGSLLALVVSC